MMRLLLSLAAVMFTVSVTCCSKTARSDESVATESSAGQVSTGVGWRQIGASVQGRPIKTMTLGYGQRKVLFIGGIHGDENEGAYSATQLPSAFQDAGLSRSVTLTILEDANPDGRAASTRVNANGVDINRNFPASNFITAEPSFGGTPLSQPESRVLFDLITVTNPALVIVMHSWVGKQFINYDGPARPAAERFATESGMPLTPSTDFSPTPGSLGSYVGRDRGTPVMTIELLKGSDPKTDWERIRNALVNAIAG